LLSSAWRRTRFSSNCDFVGGGSTASAAFLKAPWAAFLSASMLACLGVRAHRGDSGSRGLLLLNRSRGRACGRGRARTDGSSDGQAARWCVCLCVERRQRGQQPGEDEGARARSRFWRSARDDGGARLGDLWRRRHYCPGARAPGSRSITALHLGLYLTTPQPRSNARTHLSRRAQTRTTRRRHDEGVGAPRTSCRVAAPTLHSNPEEEPRPDKTSRRALAAAMAAVRPLAGGRVPLPPPPPTPLAAAAAAGLSAASPSLPLWPLRHHQPRGARAAASASARSGGGGGKGDASAKRRSRPGGGGNGAGPAAPRPAAEAPAPPPPPAAPPAPPPEVGWMWSGSGSGGRAAATKQSLKSAGLRAKK
jgi:hypothetical protein